jgi:hypothetical protein
MAVECWTLDPKYVGMPIISDIMELSDCCWVLIIPRRAVRGRSFRSICLFSTSSNTVSNPWHSLRYVGKPRLDEKTYNCIMYIAFPCFITGVASANSCSHLYGKNKLGAKTLCGKGGLSQAKDDRSWDSS